MNDTRAASRQGNARAQGWQPAARPTLAAWLHLAATPTFAGMALMCGIGGSDASAMLCHATPGIAPFDGMATMYLLMALFHCAPWLRRIQWWRRANSRWLH